MKNNAAQIFVASDDISLSRAEVDAAFGAMRDELSRYICGIILKAGVCQSRSMAANDNDRAGPRPPTDSAVSASAIRQSLSGDPHFRATVLNELHVGLLRAADRGGIKAAFCRPTIFVIARRITQRLVRDAARHELHILRSSASREVEVDALSFDASRDPEEIAAASEEVRIRRELFASLSDENQQLLQAVGEGETYEELARRFGSTVPALKTRVSRLRGELKDRLQMAL